jgi:hypothetical protein
MNMKGEEATDVAQTANDEDGGLVSAAHCLSQAHRHVSLSGRWLIWYRTMGDPALPRCSDARIRAKLR